MTTPASRSANTAALTRPACARAIIATTITTLTIRPVRFVVFA